MQKSIFQPGFEANMIETYQNSSIFHRFPSFSHTISRPWPHQPPLFYIYRSHVAGEWLQALELFARSARRDVLTFNSCMTACARSSCWRTALQLMEEMPSARLRPSASTGRSTSHPSAAWCRYRGHHGLRRRLPLGDGAKDLHGPATAPLAAGSAELPCAHQRLCAGQGGMGNHSKHNGKAWKSDVL